MWAIYNSIKGWTFYNLSQEELNLLIGTLSPNERRLTFVSQENSEKWIPLAETNCGDLNERYKKGAHYPKTEIAVNAEHDTDFFIFKPQKRAYARLHDRYEVKYKAVIEGHNQQFDSYTVNISEGGIYFLAEIPDWVSGYFIVKIYSENQDYQLICSLVEDQKVRHRVQIMSEENDPNYLRYKDWLKTLSPSTIS